MRERGGGMEFAAGRVWGAGASATSGVAGTGGNGSGGAGAANDGADGMLGTVAVHSSKVGGPSSGPRLARSGSVIAGAFAGGAVHGFNRATTERWNTSTAKADR